jgi:hypothetical protein
MYGKLSSTASVPLMMSDDDFTLITYFFLVERATAAATMDMTNTTIATKILKLRFDFDDDAAGACCTSTLVVSMMPSSIEALLMIGMTVAVE